MVEDKEFLGKPIIRLDYMTIIECLQKMLNWNMTKKP
ncbi:hypothetical protein LCGC14_0905380 [marine sediment metagenome]|uniref:Uncharacterized protein n=1 Tax=marine sediment metagenome TaxID=412755 RepID=A0A0F9RE88_9ZZZZ